MRQLVVLLTALVVGMMAVGATGAAQARHVTININESFRADFLSTQCGFEVFVDNVLDLKVTLVYNKDGLIVREIDTAGGGRITYRSPDTGGSFSFTTMSSTWDYGAGATIGSSVVVSLHGLFGHVPGFIPSDAGLFRYLGVVTGFDEFGIPIVDFVDVIADVGNRESGERITSAICAGLAGP